MTEADAKPCPFCNPPPDRVVLASEVGFAIRDAFPLADGHTLVVPSRHVGSIYDLPSAEQADLWALVAAARRQLMREFPLDALNVGINDGEAAGQTVLHAHIHLIPRRRGDVPDPRGGIRWVIPERARYWGEDT